MQLEAGSDFVNRRYTILLELLPLFGVFLFFSFVYDRNNIGREIFTKILRILEKCEFLLEADIFFIVGLYLHNHLDHLLLKLFASRPESKLVGLLFSRKEADSLSMRRQLQPEMLAGHLLELQVLLEADLEEQGPGGPPVDEHRHREAQQAQGPLLGAGGGTKH